MFEAVKRRERDWRMVGGIVFSSGALALAAACGGDSSDKQAETAPTSPEATQPVDTSTTPSTEGVNLTFDDLGANSSIIRVYPGVEAKLEDKLSNGTYNDGDTVPAECKIDGRTVESVPPETPRESDDWIRIHGTPGETQYATAVYVESPEKLISQLPDC